MNFIKVNGQFINLDNVTTINFSAKTMARSHVDNQWFVVSDPNTCPPDYETRMALVAEIEYANTEEYSRIIDAEPLQEWLNKASVDVTAAYIESRTLQS